MLKRGHCIRDGSVKCQHVSWEMPSWMCLRTPQGSLGRPWVPSLPCFLLCLWMNWEVAPVSQGYCLWPASFLEEGGCCRQGWGKRSCWLSVQGSVELPKQGKGSIPDARLPGGTSHTGSISNTRGRGHSTGESIFCHPRRARLCWCGGQEGEPCNMHPTVGWGEDKTDLEEDRGRKESSVDLPGCARAQLCQGTSGKGQERYKKGRSKKERMEATLAYVQDKGTTVAFYAFLGSNSMGVWCGSAGGPFLALPCKVDLLQLSSNLPPLCAFFSSFQWSSPPPPNSIIAVSMHHLSFLYRSHMRHFMLFSSPWLG